MAPLRKKLTKERRLARKNGKTPVYNACVEQMFRKDEELAFNLHQDVMDVLEITKEMFNKSQHDIISKQGLDEDVQTAWKGLRNP